MKLGATKCGKSNVQKSVRFVVLKRESERSGRVSLCFRPKRNIKREAEKAARLSDERVLQRAEAIEGERKSELERLWSPAGFRKL
jgi:hypothetical protein